MDLNKLTKKELVIIAGEQREIISKQKKLINIKDKIVKSLLRLSSDILNDWAKSTNVWFVLYYIALIGGIMLGMYVGRIL